MGSKTILRNEEAFMSIVNDLHVSARNIIKEEFIRFWKYYDAIYYTIHTQIIEKLYFLQVRPLEEVAFVCCIDDKTLFRYRKKYMELFLALCREHDVEG